MKKLILALALTSALFSCQKETTTPNNSGNNTTDTTKTYRLTKSLGIKYCLDLIQHLTEMTTHFNSHKKKDDLADSFLQGAYFYTSLR